MAISTDSNPLLDPSDLPYGLPRFGDITVADYLPAIEAGMAEQRAAVTAIVADPAAPSFANTLVPLETSGLRLHRALAIFGNHTSADTTPELDALDAELAPRLAAHADAITLDPDLFARLEAVAAAVEPLEAEESWLLERTLTEFRLAGAGLAPEAKVRLSELNARLSELQSRFKIELQADANDLALLIDDPAELEGLSAGERSAAAEAATAAGHPGRHLISLVLPTIHPYLRSLADPRTRARLLEAQQARGRRGNDHDTRAIALEIVRLRAERARLLGAANHAELVLADACAKTPEAVREMLSRLAGPAAENARREHAQLEAVAGGPVGAADWPFHAEQVRRAEHDVDVAALAPYFEADRVLFDGVFFCAERLFGLRVSERPDLSGYHEEVRVFEVTEEDATPVGLYLLDLYARPSKRGGAWMSSFIDAASLAGSETAIVVNNLNVPKPAAGEPTLLTLTETTTLFHEFGHALHGLLGRSTFPSLAGTNVPRDFVEFPSQVNEMWMLWPEAFERFARHHVTDAPLDPELVQRLRDSRAFGEGYATSEYLAAAWIDLAWHLLSPEQVPDGAAAVDEFEATALAEVGLDNPAVPPRYRSPYFAHIFAGGGYAAGYYSYIWAEVLDADTAEWFEAQGGLVRESGEAYRRHILAVGGTREPLAAYEGWRGRPAPLEPLLRRRGLR